MKAAHLLSIALTSALALTLAGCASVPFVGHDPSTAVRLPADLNERELENIGAISQTLRAAGYQTIDADASREADYTLDFELDRRGPISVYSYITLRRNGVAVASGSAQRTAIERLFRGSQVYQEIFDRSLADFRSNLRPATPAAYGTP